MPIETHDEFIARHGGRGVRAEGGRLLFADGATVRPFPGGMAPVEPSSDSHERLAIIRSYWTARLKQIATQFGQVQAAARLRIPHLNWSGEHFGPRPPGLDSVGLLGWLQRLAVEPSARLAEIEAEIASLPQNVELEVRERRLKIANHKRYVAGVDRLRDVEAMTLTPNA